MKFNLKTVQNSVTRSASKIVKAGKKASPEITFVAGIGLMIFGMVEVGKASRKLDTTMEPVKEEIETLKERHEHPENFDIPEDAVYTDSQYRKDLTNAYFKAGFTLAKLYLPAVLTTGLSVVSLTTSNRILKKRNAALTAAYAAIDTSYKAYRSRVIERFGKDLDKELRYGVKNVEVEETTVDSKGKEKTVKRNITTVDSNFESYSEYAKFFDERSSEYEDDPEYNKAFIMGVEKVVNQQLKAKGHIFLNEVYEQLGLPLTKAGQIVGWVYDEENPIGDNYITFGIFETKRQSNRDFVNGYDSVILLDFNVDGKIVNILN